jgi:23S rRNA pseudouridine2605 synthase
MEKTYQVQVNRVADDQLLAAIAHGVRVDGDRLHAKRARMIRHGAKNSWIEILLDEGKNRQIRRILNELGVEVLRLVRVGIGSLQLGALKKGEVRELSREEKNALDEAMSRRKKNPAPAR